jgi:hypothetical protein
VRLLSDDQPLRIAVAFARETAKSPTARLCAACVEVLEVSGAGITVFDGARPGPICVSNSSVASLEILQFTSGQGPCRDAFTTGRAVHAPHLDAKAALRWPPFVDLARSQGIRAVSAYPLVTEADGVGVLTLYRTDEGNLSDAQQVDSAAVARVLTDTLMSLRTETFPSSGPEESVPYRAEIYQAAGMSAVHLGIAPDQALHRIRAHSSSHGLSVLMVALEIVALRLRLLDDRTDRQREE